MSGHSHWATTKRSKDVKDAARGKIFGRLTKAITIAAKSGADPASNPRLRMAVEQAKAANMPKDNIDRAILKGSRSDVQLEEISYEGFGPGGIGIIIEVATDNRNRTGAEIKSLLDRGGGNLAGPGSVSFNFSPKGLVVVEKQGSIDEQMLALIDLGAEDVEEEANEINVFVLPSDVAIFRDKVEKLGYKVESLDLIRKPKSYLLLEEANEINKAVSLLETLEDHEDVQKVYTNLDMEAGMESSVH